MAHQLNLNTTALEELKAKAQALPAEKKVQASKSVTPGTTEQTVTPDSGYDGLASVTVNAMPTGSVGTPSISVNSSGLITATAAVDAGYVDGADKSATKQLTTKAAATITPGTSNQTIAAGTYLTGKQTIKGDSNLVAENIKSGTSIFGVTGTMKAGGFPNGTEWTAGNLDLNGGLLRYCNQMWFCINSSTGLYYSEDGKTWEPTNLTGSGLRDTLCYANGIWVIGEGNQSTSDTCKGIYYSEDGKTWIQSNITNVSFSKIVYANGVWVAGSLNRPQGLYYSTDGKLWQQGSQTGAPLADLLNANGIWAASTGQSVYYSLDGKTWQQSNITNDTGFFYYEDGLWIFLGLVGGLYYSIDGKTWTQSNITQGIVGVAKKHKGIWVVADGLLNQGIYYSNDGKVWAHSNLTTGKFNTDIHDVNGTLFILQSTGSSYCSKDGITWEQSEWPISQVLYANNIWISKMQNRLGLWYSIDGENWQQSNTSATVQNFLYADGLWVAISVGRSYYSVTWEPST